MTSKLIERLINKEYLTERERKEWLNTIKERLETLEKEKKEWKEYSFLLELSKQHEESKNEKLKKAIEIIKKNYTVRLEKLEPYYHIVICGNIRRLSQQEYDLLKEVLGDA